MKIYIGYDPRETIAYHVCVQSIIINTLKSFSIQPLVREAISNYVENKFDGSNAFIYSRFLVPYLNEYRGWALFIDGDMICQDDLSKLFEGLDKEKAVYVVKHNYKTKAAKKYLNNDNVDYPRKNWSSVIVWNCGHKDNSVLTPDYINNSTGSHLHRFGWLSDNFIGELSPTWNWLVDEYEENRDASILHYTLGTPCFKDYQYSDCADIWLQYYNLANEGMNK